MTQVAMQLPDHLIRLREQGGDFNIDFGTPLVPDPSV